jgi:predicted nucleic acid-binding protein
MAGEPLFVDTNVLVYANQYRAAEHARALSLINRAESAGLTLWISRQVLREYAAAVTRPQPDGAALPMGTAVKRMRWFAQRLTLADETAPVTAELLDLLDRIPVAGRQVHDANIVATMLANGIRRLLTFNLADFRRFELLIALEPLP